MGIILTVAVVVVFGVSGLYYALRGGAYLSTYITSFRSDRDTVGRVTEGGATVDLSGTARVHEQTDRAPFTGTETLAYEGQIMEGTGKGTNRRGTDDSKNQFLLEDGTGTVLVDPAGATLRMETTSEIEVDPEEQPPESIAEFLDSSVWFDADSAPITRLYLESRIDPGDDVRVYGPVRDIGHSEDVPARIDAVVGMDDPQDGPVDVTDLTLSGITDRFMSNVEQPFVVTKQDEITPGKHFLNGGMVTLVFGVLLIAAAVGTVLIGGV